MTNVIVFPSKVFREWGPIAQALARYLSTLGATTHEAKSIIDRLQLTWMQYGLPLTRPVLRQVIDKPAGARPYPDSTGVKYHSRDMPRKRTPEKPQSLFELAKADYDQSKSR